MGRELGKSALSVRLDDEDECSILLHLSQTKVNLQKITINVLYDPKINNLKWVKGYKLK